MIDAGIDEERGPFPRFLRKLAGVTDRGDFVLLAMNDQDRSCIGLDARDIVEILTRQRAGQPVAAKQRWQATRGTP